MCPEYSERIKTKNTSVREAIREALLGIQAMNSSPSISESEQVRSSSSNSSSRRRRSKQFGEQLTHASAEFQHAVASGAKRPRDTSGRNPKKIKVSECSRRRSLTSNAQDRRIPLFGGVGAAQETGDVNQSKEERVAKWIEVDAHEMECFHCRVKETPRWHVFQGVVSCVCSFLSFSLDLYALEKKIQQDDPVRIRGLTLFFSSSSFFLSLFVILLHLLTSVLEACVCFGAREQQRIC